MPGREKEKTGCDCAPAQQAPWPAPLWPESHSVRLPERGLDVIMEIQQALGSCWQSLDKEAVVCQIVSYCGGETHPDAVEALPWTTTLTSNLTDRMEPLLKKKESDLFHISIWKITYRKRLGNIGTATLSIEFSGDQFDFTFKGKRQLEASYWFKGWH